MKLAISISGSSVDAPFDARFGRAAAFCVVDVDTDERTTHENPGRSSASGAGVQAAQFVAGLGVQAVVSGAFGPHAFTTLQAAEVEMYLAPSGRTGSVAEILALFKRGELSKATGATGDGHHDKHHGGRG